MKAALLVALAAAVLSLTARPAAAQISVNTPDIRDWGCVVDPGDNSTDAAPCINKAWAARKDIYVPAGYWHLRSEISCPGGGSLKTDGTSTVFTVGSASHDFVGSDGVLKPGSVPAAQGPGTIGAVPNCSVGSFTMKFYQPVYPNMNSIADVIQYPPAIEANNMSAVSFPGDTIIENAWDCWSALGNTNAVGGQHLAMVKCSSYDKGLVIGGTTGPGGATSESDLSWDQEAWGMTPEQATIFGAYGQGVNGTAVFSGQPANLDTLTVNGATITFVTGAPTGPQVQIGANLATTLQSLATLINASPATYATGVGKQFCLPAQCPNLNTILFINLTQTMAAPSLTKSSSVITVASAPVQSYAAQLGRCDTCFYTMTSYEQEVLMNGSTLSAPGSTFIALDMDGANFVNSSVNRVRISAGYAHASMVLSTVTNAITIFGPAFEFSDSGLTVGSIPCFGVNVTAGYVSLSGRYTLGSSSQPSICESGAASVLKIADAHFVVAGPAALTGPMIRICGVSQAACSSPSTAEFDYDNSNSVTGHVAGASGNFLEIDNDNANNFVNGNFKGWSVNLTFMGAGYQLLGYYDLPDVKYPLVLTPVFVNMGTAVFTVNTPTTPATYQLRGDLVVLNLNTNFSTSAYTGASGNFQLNTNAPLFQGSQSCPVGQINNFVTAQSPSLRAAPASSNLLVTKFTSGAADSPFSTASVPPSINNFILTAACTLTVR